MAGSINDEVQINQFTPETGQNQNVPDKSSQGRSWVLKCKNLKNQAIESRRKYDWEWLVRNLYFRGYHFARYNRGTNTVVFSTRTGVRIPVNLVAAHMRGVRNQVTSFQPKWEVLPSVTTESAMENARWSGKVLDYIYDKAQIKRKIKEVVNDSLWSSIGIWMFDIDSKGNIIINRIDPYDLYVDPNIKGPDLNDPEYGAEFVIRTIQMSLDAIKKNKKYSNIDNLRGDNVTASAEYKRFLMTVTRNQYYSQAKEQNQTIILNEAYVRERQDDGTIKIRMIHYVDSMQEPLMEQLLDTDEYPFEIMQGDITPGELYGESWIKHLIPINRVIDALESHVFEYNHFFARGRFVIDKNSGVRIIVNQHGQIIEKNRGSQVQALTISPLPPSPENQIERMGKRLEDISGVHDVSLGRLPGTIRSGVAIAELRQSDATNQADLVDNLEEFLSRAGKRILKLVAQNWDTSKLISVTSLGGKPTYFMAIGESGAEKFKKKATPGKKGNTYTFGEMELPLAIIGADNEVKVQVGSWLAYTKEAREEKLKELFRLGAIDQQTYLSFAEFADIDGIVQRTREEALLQATRNQPSAAVTNEFGVNLSDEELAMAENELMLEGQDQPVHPQDNHEVHLAIHSKYEKNDLVRAHMNEHIQQMEWVQHMQTQPVQPGQTSPAPAQVGPGAQPFNPMQPAVMGGPEGPGLQPTA